MAALPYMQLYVADYLADTAHLTTEEHGAYLLLLFSYWQTGKPLRADRLASVSRLSNERWTDVERTLKEFFHVSKGLWTHFRVEADLEKVDSKSKKNSNAGKASAKARALAKQELEENELTNVGTDVATNVEQTYQRNVNHTDTDTDTEQKQDQKPSSSGKGKAKKSKPEFELPPGIDRMAWDGFLEMRKTIKKPLTENGMGLALGKLEKLKALGHDPNDVLNQSTFNSWQGLFEIKEEYRNGQTNAAGNRQAGLSLVDQVRQRNAEAQAHRDREARQGFTGDGELFTASVEGGGFDFDGEFSRIDDADGKIMGADD